MKEEDHKLDLLVLAVPTSISSSSPDKAVASSSLTLFDDLRQYEELLQRVAAALQITLQKDQDTQQKVLQPSGPNWVALPVNEAIMEPVEWYDMC